MEIGSALAAIREAARCADGGDAVIGTDDAGTIVYWNDAAELLYGWKSFEALGRNVMDVTPALISRNQAQVIMERLSAGHAWSGLFTVRHRDGSPITVHVADTPVFDGTAVVGMVGVSRRPPTDASIR